LPDAIELTVPPGAAGKRLDAWLAEAAPGSSRVLVQRAIDRGRVLVDGRPRQKSFRLEGGERVEADLVPPDEPIEPIAAEPRIDWEDEYLLVVDKPAGVVVHPAAGHRAQTLVEALADRAGGAWQPNAVHRLDRDTSGLMLVAKDEAVRDRLRKLLRAREIEREYLALVKGRLTARRGTIDAPLGRDTRHRTRMSTRTDKPRTARTHFEVERFAGGFTLVRARLETGRTHQIRVHFAAAGHPVCGDREYGGRGLLGLDRQFLHSARIALPHPVSGAKLERTSRLPPDLEAALERAGK
jgi:23S rRNA pseudouridine1911/1915/1917 synthase